MPIDPTSTNLTDKDMSERANKNLRGLHLAYHRCVRTNFSGLDLAGANFTGADVTGARFDGCVLDGATFKDAFVTVGEEKDQRQQPMPLAQILAAKSYAGVILPDGSTYETAQQVKEDFAKSEMQQAELEQRLARAVELEQRVKELEARLREAQQPPAAQEPPQKARKS